MSGQIEKTGSSQLELILRREAAKDDVAKLVYADWLDEKGDPRGELIRINVELSKMDLTVGLKACQYCNKNEKPSAEIYPTGCDHCAEQSGWLEITSPEKRKHYNDLVERRLEILESLPRRWYQVFDTIGGSQLDCGYCMLATGDETCWSMGFTPVLIQTVVPYE